jgi:hypothetical protein
VQICALCWLILLRLTMHGTNIKMYIGLHVKYQLFLSDFNDS